MSTVSGLVSYGIGIDGGFLVALAGLGIETRFPIFGRCVIGIAALMALTGTIAMEIAIFHPLG